MVLVIITTNKFINYECKRYCGKNDPKFLYYREYFRCVPKLI